MIRGIFSTKIMLNDVMSLFNITNHFLFPEKSSSHPVFSWGSEAHPNHVLSPSTGLSHRESHTQAIWRGARFCCHSTTTMTAINKFILK